jgi:hypothetical protein
LQDLATYYPFPAEVLDELDQRLGVFVGSLAGSPQLQIQSTMQIVPTFHRNSTLGELMVNPHAQPILQYLQFNNTVKNE